MRDDGLRRGAWSGLVAGLGSAALMYVASALIGLRTLPELLQQPILSAMPGPVFGFLIDRLQHAGKVLEEAGLLLAMVLSLAVLGAVAGLLAERRRLPRPGIVAGAAAWLLVTLLGLPVAGEGLLGLRGGLNQPLGYAVVFGVYAFLWEMVWSSAPESAPDLGRRRLVTAVPVGVALASLGLLGLLKVPGWVRDVSSPPEAGLSGPVPEITPVANFYVVSKNFNDPVVSASGWALRVTGLVQRPLRLDYARMQSLPSVTELVTMECVSNEVGGPLMSTGSFTGIPLRELLTMAAPQPKAAGMTFKARDGFTESIGLKTVMDDPSILVAYQLGGQPLPAKHGFPARVLIPGRYGMRAPKWLDEIELMESEGGGYWEGQGWDHQAVVKTTARFDTPQDGALLGLGQTQLAGVAFAGTRGVQAVEWSVDGGRTWAAVQLSPPLSPFTWVLWRAPWTPRGEGAYSLQVRARDGRGDLQSSGAAPSFPNGASGYHTIRVNARR
jgi:DMSO/TMAO reductase YedYZ molybdopterin-dependent catalytic subunit